MILKYLSGTVSTTLNHKYNIHGSATLMNWVKRYQAYGSKGVIVSHTKAVYSYKYKLKVLNWMKSNHKSYPDTALHFNILSPSTIFCWERRLEC